MRNSVFSLALIFITGGLIAQQPNSLQASLTLNGNGGGLTGPFNLNLQPPATVTLTMGGAPLSPFILANANAGLGGIMMPAGLPTPFGLLDIGPPSFPPIEFVMDGFTNFGTLLGALAMVGASGTSSFSFTFPASIPCGVVLANIQALVADVTNPSGGTLTGAFTIQRPLPLPDPAPVLVSMGDDTTTNVQISGCGAFNFYGISYGSYWVNSNGSVSFGAGDTTFTESQALFNSGAARAAIVWDDLYPSQLGSTLTKFDNGSTTVIQWTNVPEFVAVGSNTMSITLNYVTQEIGFTWNALSLQDGIVGITPGGNLATVATVFGAGTTQGRIVDRLNGGALGPYTGAALESLNEVFLTGASVFNLANRTATFQPNNPGLNGYTLF